MPETTSTPEVVDWDQLPGLNGQPLDSDQLAGKAVLVVNVASKCGLTPQYEGLERLQRAYGDRGFTVLGVPCNQFAGQEPGTSDEIEGFCRTTYGTTFPMTAKLEVNGRRRRATGTSSSSAAGRNKDPRSASGPVPVSLAPCLTGARLILGYVVAERAVSPANR